MKHTHTIYQIEPKVALDHLKKGSGGSMSGIFGLLWSYRWRYRDGYVCVCKISKTHRGIPPTMRSGIYVRGVRDEVEGERCVRFASLIVPKPLR